MVLYQVVEGGLCYEPVNVGTLFDTYLLCRLLLAFTSKVQTYSGLRSVATLCQGQMDELAEFYSSEAMMPLESSNNLGRADVGSGTETHRRGGCKGKHVLSWPCGL
jgi:hypothetical protein